MRILLVDDEQELTQPLQQVLTMEGYEVDVANDGVTGLQLAFQNEYDLLILDWMLPQISGLEICQQLRSRQLSTPVLFLTAKDTLDDRVLGLDAGADDYLVKPFQLRELLARVRALLRREAALSSQKLYQKSDFNGPDSEPHEHKLNVSDAIAGKLKLADLELDLNNQLAYRGDRPIALSEKEFKLLQYFMIHRGQLLTHQQIYQHLWGESETPSSNVLAALVRLLRRKIEAAGETTLIHTVYGKGYRFNLEA